MYWRTRLPGPHRRLLKLLRTGGPVARPDGRTAAQTLAEGGPISAAVAEHLSFEAMWWVPSVVSHHDWSTYPAVAVWGAGAEALRGALEDAHPGLATSRDGSPVRDGAVVVINHLEQLADADAVEALSCCRLSETAWPADSGEPLPPAARPTNRCPHGARTEER